ncbi:efflux transporter outer membrane subunit [Pseudomonas tohonis]|uniref:efflux transporter outer membrane subunit n=1 Tax=Pseudomonas tohonis TaxID=2725477 RepID=UPI0022F056A3|nr:efflux transporter outer membrane subunit [Pseudomonas tohonis]
MRRHATLLVLAMGLGACSVGPDFTRPDAELDANWTLAGDADLPSRALQAGLEARWWEGFGDPLLASLIHRATQENLDLLAAASRVEQSRAARRSVAAGQAPAVDLGAGYSRARNSQRGLSDPSGESGRATYSLWQGGLDMAWELDLWGRVRREVEAADAGVQVSEETRRGVLLAVAAETARNYIELRGAQNALAITLQNLDIARRSLALNRTRLGDGVATQLEVAEAAAQVANLESRLAPLRQREARLANALALLLALPPGTLRDELAAKEPPAIPTGPARVPLGLPSELAERRPDIRRAEATLHAATAEVGVAEGDFYPRITLAGDLGFQALQLDDLGWDARRFAFGPALSLPLFDGGRRRGTLELSKARQQEAAIAYRGTVLAAWHEVDDALGAYQAQQRRRISLEQAVLQSRTALDNAERQYHQGTVDFLNVLSVQNALLANQAEQVDSATAAALALVDLYRALGGGWQALEGEDDRG